MTAARTKGKREKEQNSVLFGKRTNVADSHDRFANQEVNYLLARMSKHRGIVILNTNGRTEIDPAISRRFDAVVSARPRISLAQRGAGPLDAFAGIGQGFGRRGIGNPEIRLQPERDTRHHGNAFGLQQIRAEIGIGIDLGAVGCGL
ncbi:MAG: hypothetical protein ACI9MU_001737, partial [Alphaproteobacteria bacterium]